MTIGTIPTIEKSTNSNPKYNNGNTKKKSKRVRKKILMELFLPNRNVALKTEILY
jgi:hypothetical protein